MPDSKRKKKADGKRVALKTQDYERRYVVAHLEKSADDVRFAIEELEGAEQAMQRAIDRLRAGFPKASR